MSKLSNNNERSDQSSAGEVDAPYPYTTLVLPDYETSLDASFGIQIEAPISYGELAWYADMGGFGFNPENETHYVVPGEHYLIGYETDIGELLTVVRIN